MVWQIRRHKRTWHCPCKIKKRTRTLIRISIYWGWGKERRMVRLTQGILLKDRFSSYKRWIVYDRAQWKKVCICQRSWRGYWKSSQVIQKYQPWRKISCRSSCLNISLFSCNCNMELQFRGYKRWLALWNKIEWRNVCKFSAQKSLIHNQRK